MQIQSIGRHGVTRIYIKCKTCKSDNADVGPNFGSGIKCGVCGLPLQGSKRILEGADPLLCVGLGAIIGTAFVPCFGTLIGAFIGWCVTLIHPDRILNEDECDDL